jgi:hypothetical protein
VRGEDAGQGLYGQPTFEHTEADRTGFQAGNRMALEAKGVKKSGLADVNRDRASAGRPLRNAPR